MSDTKKRGDTWGIKKAKCPFCGHRLLDVPYDSAVVFTNPKTKGKPPDFVMKCKHCGKEVGIRKSDK